MVVARLVCLVPLVAGCGRLGFDGFGEGDPEPGGNMTVGVEDSSARTPFECEAVPAFATVADADVDLAVATTPTGASLFWVPTTGGNLHGIDLATSRQPSQVTLVRSGPFDQASASFIDGQLVVTVRSTLRALVHTVPMPIGPGVEIANVWGDNIAKTAIVKAGADRVMAASCSEVALHSFDAGWNGTEDTYLKTLSTSDHIEIAQLGTSALTAVSIDTGCDYELATSNSASTTRLSTTFCKQARLATSGNEVAMAFETTDTVNLVIDDVSTVTAANAMPVALGSSPRVIHHAGRYWVSYLDENANIVVGTVEDGILLLRRLAASALHDSFELAVYDGSPWVFAVDPQSSNVYGRRLCLPST
ncbi:MAG: hypothetical protein H6Q90_5936 [Deltaproteobacteria bacterium]|nr:hypothetical protein [Deltaproteobacteria bacterium]